MYVLYDQVVQQMGNITYPTKLRIQFARFRSDGDPEALQNCTREPLKILSKRPQRKGDQWACDCHGCQKHECMRTCSVSFMPKKQYNQTTINKCHEAYKT